MKKSLRTEANLMHKVWMQLSNILPRGYKTRVHSQTQNKAQWLATCRHVSASSQSLRFILSLSLRLYSNFITSWPRLLAPLNMLAWAYAYVISIKKLMDWLTLSVTIKMLVNYQRNKLARLPIEDSDQPANLRSHIRVFNRRSMGSKESNISSGGKLKLWSDTADAQTDLNPICKHMLSCTL